MQTPKIGDILFQERQIPSIPHPAGCWVLCRMNAATAYIALVSENKEHGLYAIDCWWKISTEDLSAFTPTGQTAKVLPPSPEALEQEDFNQ